MPWIDNGQWFLVAHFDDYAFYITDPKILLFLRIGFKIICNWCTTLWQHIKEQQSINFILKNIKGFKHTVNVLYILLKQNFIINFLKRKSKANI